MQDIGATLAALYFSRATTDPITLEIGVRSESADFPFNGFPKTGFTAKSLILPDAANWRVALFPPMRIYIKTTGLGATEAASVEVVFEETSEGLP